MDEARNQDARNNASIKLYNASIGTARVHCEKTSSLDYQLDQALQHILDRQQQYEDSLVKIKNPELQLFMLTFAQHEEHTEADIEKDRACEGNSTIVLWSFAP